MSVSVGGGGGKRNVNASVNLVPFIDLLSTLIAFLLVTAVWSQIEALSTNSSSTTSSNQQATPPEKKVELNVSLLMDYVEMSEGTKATKIPFINGEPNIQRIKELLGEWKGRYPDRNDLVLFSDSQAPYKHLISLMDIAIDAQFADVGVNTN